MKKLLIAATMMLGFAAVTSAQTAVKKTETKTVAAKPASTQAKVVTMDKSKPATATAKPAAKAATAKVKADGTPDMRYKENKTAAKPVEGPKKADGTPDKRFKENKAPKS